MIFKSEGEAPWSITFNLTNAENDKLECKAQYFIYNSRLVMQKQAQDAEERQIFVAQQKQKEFNLIDITEEQDEIALYDEAKMKNEKDTSDNIYKFLFPKDRQDEINEEELARFPWFDV